MQLLNDSRTLTNSDLHLNLKMTLLEANHFRLKSRKPYPEYIATYRTKKASREKI